MERLQTLISNHRVHLVTRIFLILMMNLEALSKLILWKGRSTRAQNGDHIASDSRRWLDVRSLLSCFRFCCAETNKYDLLGLRSAIVSQTKLAHIAFTSSDFESKTTWRTIHVYVDLLKTWMSLNRHYSLTENHIFQKICETHILTEGGKRLCSSGLLSSPQL